jgi:hypothetical protein|tara:strand:- start:1009 stop:1248 length:240 start_codon:yes stop_codon:yes gene_type:complete
MEISAYIVWNLIVTLILAPLVYGIRKNENEIKRVDILVNKTREEVARDYLTRNEHTIEFQRLIDKIDKLDAKIDKLITN